MISAYIYGTGLRVFVVLITTFMCWKNHPFSLTFLMEPLSLKAPTGKSLMGATAIVRFYISFLIVFILIARSPKSLFSHQKPKQNEFIRNYSRAYEKTFKERLGLLRKGWTSLERSLRCHSWTRQSQKARCVLYFTKVWLECTKTGSSITKFNIRGPHRYSWEDNRRGGAQKRNLVRMVAKLANKTML